MSRIARLKLTFEGPAEKAPTYADPEDVQASRWYDPRNGGAKCSSITPWRRLRPLASCCAASMRGTRRRPKRGYLLLEDVTDSHRIATEWPLPPTEPQCRIDRWRAGALPRRVVGCATKGSVSVAGAELTPAMVRDIYQRMRGFMGQPLGSPRRSTVGRSTLDLRALPCKTPINKPRLVTRKNLSIVHGDAHVWNVFLPNDDSANDLRLFDWGTWRPGLPAIDLAYMMAVHWYPERRRRFERPLLDHYHATLLASGVKGYDRAALDYDYRLAVPDPSDHAVVPVQRRLSARSLVEDHLERIMYAIDDLGCRELLA